MQSDADRLDVDALVTEHIQVNKAPKTFWPIHRAHGWINPNVSSLQSVSKSEEEVA